jgi:hypothetical protein
MNKYILLTKSNDIDINFLNEFLKDLLKNYELLTLNDYYLIKHQYQDDKELKEAINSYMFDVEINAKVFFGIYLNDAELDDELFVITKYFNKSLKDIFYDKKKLLSEYLTHDLEDFKNIVLKEYSNDFDMQNTLKVFFLNNMNVLKSSKELYVHRNTLINKLDRFKEKTGYDPKDFKDAYLIYSLIK